MEQPKEETSMKTIYKNSIVCFELDTEEIIKLINRLHEENPDSLNGYTIDISALLPIHFEAASHYLSHVRFDSCCAGSTFEELEEDFYEQFFTIPFDALGLPVGSDEYVLEPVAGKYPAEGMMMRDMLKIRCASNCAIKDYEQEYHVNWFPSRGASSTTVNEYCGLRAEKSGICGGTLYLIDVDYIDSDFEELNGCSGEYTYAEWDDKDYVYKEVSRQTDVKVWLLPTM